MHEKRPRPSDGYFALISDLDQQLIIDHDLGDSEEISPDPDYGSKSDPRAWMNPVIEECIYSGKDLFRNGQTINIILYSMKFRF